MGHRPTRKRKDSQSHRPGIPVGHELDLHGLTIENALRQVRMLITGKKWPPGTTIRIIHGRSNSSEDSIKTQLHFLLQGSMAPKIQDFYLEPFNPGATLIILEDA